MFLSSCTKYVIVMQCTIITTKGRPFLPLCGQDVHSVEECQLYEA